MHKMRAKACTTCRDWKVRCTWDENSTDGCTRCKTAGRRCIFDRSYKRTAKGQRLAALEEEVKRLRQTAISNSSQPEIGSQLSSHTDQSPAEGPSSPTSQRAKTIGNVTLTPAQVTELFRVYFSQCHPYLPMPLSNCPDTIYDRCPLLFWAICAAASSRNPIPHLHEPVKALVSEIMSTTPRLVEIVQALLILCIWPFPFFTMLDNPSFLYCGFAVRIGYQIGLHRAEFVREFSSKPEVVDVDIKVRRGTWLACYIVDEMQASRLGVPSSIPTDFAFIRSLEDPDLSPSLITLCRISRLNVQFSNTIGAGGQNPSGLLEPAARINMVRHFFSEMDALNGIGGSSTSEPIKIAYLCSRIQLGSFMLHYDVSRSLDTIDLVSKLEMDAMELIDFASQRNLSAYPNHLQGFVLLSTLLLIRIVKSNHASSKEILYDKIQTALQSFLSAIRVPNDHCQRASAIIQEILVSEDSKTTSQISSRQGVSLFYDAIRIKKDHVNDELTNLLDLDMDWNEIGGLF